MPTPLDINWFDDTTFQKTHPLKITSKASSDSSIHISGQHPLNSHYTCGSGQNAPAILPDLPINLGHQNILQELYGLGLLFSLNHEMNNRFHRHYIPHLEHVISVACLTALSPCKYMSSLIYNK